MAILAVDGDAAERVGTQHVLSMTWAIDPASYCALHRISLSIVIGDVLRKTTLVEGDL